MTQFWLHLLVVQIASFNPKKFGFKNGPKDLWNPSHHRTLIETNIAPGRKPLQKETSN